MRGLQLLDHLEQLLPEIPLVSPLELIEIEKKKRKRVRN
jgi:hypothetical protein